jgi:hypothetical protein
MSHAKSRAGLLFFFFGLDLYGQQAIINMPSADITPRDKNFFMHESQWRQWKPSPYWYGTHFFCRGVGHATELAVTSYNAGAPGAENFVTGVGFKSAPQLFSVEHPEREVKLTVGQMTLFSHRAQGLGAFAYAHLSMRLPRWKTRLTGGGWAGTKQLLKRNTGDFLAGLEQPLDSKGHYVLVNEWFRGRHDLGFFITGLLFHPNKRDIVVVAYKFANRPENGKNGIVLEYGLIF